MTHEPIGLGIITPSANSIMERDFPRLEIPGVGFHFSRVLNSEDSLEQLSAMKDRAREAAKLLSHARWVNAVALGCTSGSFIGGVGYDEDVCKSLTAACGLPAITTSSSILAALRALGMRKLAVFDPYEPWLSAKLVAYLQGNGFEVVASHCNFGMTRTEGLDDYRPINEWIAARVPDEADGVYIGCTNFTWLRGIAPLEKEIGRPVVTSNLATVWKLLQVAGYPHPVPLAGTRLGQLDFWETA